MTAYREARRDPYWRWRARPPIEPPAMIAHLVRLPSGRVEVREGSGATAGDREWLQGMIERLGERP
jgi:hypothetical protein